MSDSRDGSLSRRKWIGLAAMASLGSYVLAATKAIAKPFTATGQQGVGMEANALTGIKGSGALRRIHHVRHALLADPVCLPVQAWLRPIYRRIPLRFPASVANQTIAGMTNVLSPVIEKDSRLQSALQEVAQFLSSPVKTEYIDAYESIKRPGSNMMRSFVSIVYARALLLLRPSIMDGSAIVADLKNILSSPSSSVAKYLEKQRTLPETFVAHLATFAEVEAQTDPHLSLMMDEAVQLFGAHKPSLAARDPLQEPDSGLDALADHNASAWWSLPTTLAFAMTVWEQTGFSEL